MLLLETLLPGLDTFAAAADIRRIRPATKIGILTRHAQVSLFNHARHNRLNGFVLKADGFEELHYAIKTMLRGGFYCPPSMSAAVVDPHQDPDPMKVLTEREKSIFSLYAQGYVTKDIANTLNISVKTAETHLETSRVFGWNALAGHTP